MAAGTTNWRTSAKCMEAVLKRDDEDDTDDGLDFFTTDTDERYRCRAICFACPVRWACLREALSRPELIGIWGGVDEYEIRRALSVNAKGEPCSRARKPRCPYCKSHLLTFGNRVRAGVPVRCMTCDLDWVQPILRRPRRPAEAVITELHLSLAAEACTATDQGVELAV